MEHFSKQCGRVSSNERNHLLFRVGRSSRSWRKPLTAQRSEEQRRVNDGGNATHTGVFSPFTIRQRNIPRGVSPFESLSRDPTRRGKDLTEAWLDRRCPSRSRCIITVMIISKARYVGSMQQLQPKVVIGDRSPDTLSPVNDTRTDRSYTKNFAVIQTFK